MARYTEICIFMLEAVSHTHGRGNYNSNSIAIVLNLLRAQTLGTQCRKEAEGVSVY